MTSFIRISLSLLGLLKDFFLEKWNVDAFAYLGKKKKFWKFDQILLTKWKLLVTSTCSSFSFWFRVS